MLRQRYSRLQAPRPGEAVIKRAPSPSAGIITAAVPGGAGAASFDGKWRFRLNLNTGEVSCQDQLIANIVIDGRKMSGKVNHPYVGQIILTGEIDAAGNLKIGGQGGLVLRADGVADSPTTASGTVQVTVAGLRCGGKWKAEKRS